MKKQTIGLVFLGLAMVPLAGCATGNSPNHESSGQYVNDSAITSKVKTRLLEDEHLKAFQIHVETYKGTVMLSGFVNRPSQVRRATRIAEGVSGVQSVKNDLVLKSTLNQ
ncbi:MAG TPA: BON domain-containing protein [Acidiferrobacteraceae bacterium]|nr:BON domain-containing protein [Acidiferrobacteraceae bacterium]